MEIVNQIYEYIQIASMIVAIASVIASFTPTPKDDEVLVKLYKIVDLLALNVGKAKDK